MKKTILLTIDVEDWFQVENFKQYIRFSDWDSCEHRVEKSTHRLLDFLDQQKCLKPDTGEYGNPCATFFILGWLAEKYPQLVREIHDRGHEVASHGYYHHLCNRESRENLKKDLAKSRKLLEDIVGFSVKGYRAPSFSVDNEILNLIKDSGYLYDSSYNSFAMHGRYGSVSLPENRKPGIAVKMAEHFYELPVSNLNMGKQILPWGGGGYFRLIPFPVFRQGINQIFRHEDAYLFYMHPWEIDPEQPRVKQASAFFKFRHYSNLHRTEAKLSGLFQSFADCCFMSCRQYLKESAKCA
ncbi:MAG: DUF3473 domain-containing protein [Desulfobacterales bacterium]